VRALQELSSSRRSSIEPRKITVKSALRASHAMLGHRDDPDRWTE
jgi:hypothetical protein